MKRFRSLVLGVCASWLPLAGFAEDAPLGRMVPVGGHALHLYCTGAGEPVVVLEAGIGGNHLDWLRVQPRLAGAATVCSYDRAGYGWSERGPKPRTARVIAAELRALLGAAGLAPPYLVVGHSFGGLVARVFAADWPDETAGLVLVDAMTPDQHRTFAAAGVALPQPPSRGVIFSGRDILTYGIPEPFRDIAYALARSDKTRSFLFNELRNIESSMDEAGEARPRADLPVRVLVHGDRQWDAIYPDGRMEDLWLSMQISAARDLGADAPVIVPGAGHQTQLDDPAAVAGAVRAMILDLRASDPPTPR